MSTLLSDSNWAYHSFLNKSVCQSSSLPWHLCALWVLWLKTEMEWETLHLPWMLLDRSFIASLHLHANSSGKDYLNFHSFSSLFCNRLMFSCFSLWVNFLQMLANRAYITHLGSLFLGFFVIPQKDVCCVKKIVYCVIPNFPLFAVLETKVPENITV